MIGFVLIMMFGLMLLGVPVAFSIVSTGAVYMSIASSTPLTLIIQKLVGGVDSFPLLAIPLFTLAGNLMVSGGIARRLVNWSESLVGAVAGGLGFVAIISCAVFAALSGSAPATVVAIGAIMIPSLVEKGYTKEHAGGMIAVAGALGPIIPPSIPMIIYAVNMGLSVSDMFLGGVLPGIIITVVLMSINYVKARRSPEILSHKNESHFSFKAFLKQTKSAFGALLMPVIILGGIYGGIFTPTEAASVGVVYGFVVGVFVYRELKMKDIPKVIVKSMEASAMVCFVTAAANLFSWIINVTHASQVITQLFTSVVHDKTTYLIMLCLLMFVVGALLDNIASIIILAPILVPIGIALGCDPLHLGVLFVILVVIGFVTPPFGYNLFAAVSLTKLPLAKIAKGALPYMIALMLCAFLFAFVPEIITFLPNLK